VRRRRKRRRWRRRRWKRRVAMETPLIVQPWLVA